MTSFAAGQNWEPTTSRCLPAPCTPFRILRWMPWSQPLAAVAVASAGVSVEQIVEPFAMVGPYLDNSLEMVRKFQSWWDAVRSQAAASAEATGGRVDEAGREGGTDDSRPARRQLAAEEPIDVESLGKSVLVDAFGHAETDAVEPGVYVTAIDMLVGGSPIIATIEEDYLPYDLSARDIKLWSVFPISTHPFCIRSRVGRDR